MDMSGSYLEGIDPMENVRRSRLASNNQTYTAVANSDHATLKLQAFNDSSNMSGVLT